MGIVIDSSILIAAERRRLDIARHVAGREDQEFPLPADVPVTLGPVGPGSAVFAYGPNDSSVSVSVQPLPWLAQVVLALGRFFERRAA